MKPLKNIFNSGRFIIAVIGIIFVIIAGFQVWINYQESQLQKIEAMRRFNCFKSDPPPSAIDQLLYDPDEIMDNCIQEFEKFNIIIPYKK